jgi:regulator of cell morphogenesis and NO signaling
MTIRPDTLVADIAAAAPATIAAFQRYRLEFCCGGRIPLAEACAAAGLDTTAVLADLLAAGSRDEPAVDWRTAPLSALVTHIQERYHVPLRNELPRLTAMMDKVASRHGQRLPYLLELRDTFETMKAELLEHMAKEDAVLFPAVVALEQDRGDRGPWQWIGQPIDVMEAEHDAAGAALARMRALTSEYTPPPDACPTFRGLYYGLAQLESDMHRHVHLENHVLFPRALAVAGQVTTRA